MSISSHLTLVQPADVSSTSPYRGGASLDTEPEAEAKAPNSQAEQTKHGVTCDGTWVSPFHQGKIGFIVGGVGRGVSMEVPMFFGFPCGVIGGCSIPRKWTNKSPAGKSKIMRADHTRHSSPMTALGKYLGGYSRLGLVICQVALSDFIRPKKWWQAGMILVTVLNIAHVQFDQ